MKDKKEKIKWAEIPPAIHGIKRILLIPPYAMNRSRHIRPKVIKHPDDY